MIFPEDEEMLMSELTDTLWTYLDSGITIKDLRRVINNILDAWEPLPDDF